MSNPTKSRSLKTVKKAAEIGKSKVPRKPGFDLDKDRTIFLRNLPYDADDSAIKEALSKYGDVEWVCIVKDKETGNSRGTAFARFASSASAGKCLAEEEHSKDILKDFYLQNKAKGKAPVQKVPAALEGVGVSIQGRRVVVCKPVSKDEVEQKRAERQRRDGEKAEEKRGDLVNVGYISPESKEFQALSPHEQRLREASFKERRTKLQNPNYKVCPTRLCFRNLPLKASNLDLKNECLRAVGREARKEVLKAKIMVDKMRNKSMCYGFVNFKSHAAALKTLEGLNNQAMHLADGVVTKGKLIAEFAVDDVRKVRISEAKREKFLKACESKKVDVPVMKAKKAPKPKSEAEGGKKLSRGQRQRLKRREAREKAEAEPNPTKTSQKANNSKGQIGKVVKPTSEARFSAKRTPVGSKTMNAKRVRKSLKKMSALPSRSVRDGKRVTKSEGGLPEDWEAKRIAQLE